MKKFLLAIFTFISVSSIAYSQQKEVAIDPNAKKILDNASVKFNSSTGLTAKLSIVVDNEQTEKKKTIPGSVKLKGDKFCLSIEDVDTYFDGKTEYVYLKKEKEVNISEPNKEDLKDINPILLMKSYNKGYKMKYMGSATVKGKQVDNVNLYPNDRSKQFSIVTISIDKKTQMPVMFKVKGKNGINTIVNVVNYSKTKLNDSEFVFNTKSNKDIEIIDLR